MPIISFIISKFWINILRWNKFYIKYRTVNNKAETIIYQYSFQWLLMLLA